MKKVIAVAAVIGLAVGLTWAAERVGGWLGFAQQESAEVAEQSTRRESAPPGDEGVSPSSPGNEGIASGTEGVTPSDENSAAPPELSAEVTSIEEDLARIEEALDSEDVLEEFTPSEPLSADNPVVWPTDI